MKTAMNQTKTFNFILEVLCLAVIAICVNELFIKGYRPALMNSGAAIGKVLRSTNTVKLKKDNLFSWIDAQDRSTLNENDLIYTHENSTTTFKLGDQNEIQLFERTLIQVQNQKDLEIESGKVAFNLSGRNSSISISLAGKKYKISSSNAKVTIEKKAEKNKISVSSGEVTIKAEDIKEEIVVKKDEALNIAQKEIKVNYEPIKILEPIEQFVETENDKALVNFKVEAPNNFNYRIFMANKEDMSDTFTRKKIEGENEKEREINLFPGHYYYQIVGENGTDTIKSEVKEIEVTRNVAAPKLLAPLSGYKEYVYKEQAKIDLFYEGESPSKKFLVEVFDEDENIIKSSISTDGRYQLVTNTFGKLNWQVRSFGEYLNGQVSKKFLIELIKVDFSKTKPQVIELEKPNQKVTFKWESEGRSMFQVSRDPDFKKVLYKITTRKSKVDYVFEKTGVFYWKSVKITKDGKTEVLPPVKVLIRPTPPPIKPEKLPELNIKVRSSSTFIKYIKKFISLIIPTAHAAGKTKIAELKWPKVKRAKTYHIEIYSDKKLTKLVKTIETSNNNFDWKVNKSGTYYWRFKYTDFWDRPSPFSEPSKLKISIIKRKPKPKKVIAKKSTPKPVIKKTLPKPKPAKVYNWHMAYAPSIITYEGSAGSNSFDISGNAINGWKLDGQFKLKNIPLKTQINFAQGVVFDEENLLSLNARLGHQKSWRAIQWDYGVDILYLSMYESQNSLAKSKGESVFASMYLSANYSLKKWPLHLKTALSFGGATGFQIGASYRYYRKMPLYYDLGLNFGLISVEDGSDEVDLQQIQLFIARPLNI
jgi:hypothetical protein